MLPFVHLADHNGNCAFKRCFHRLPMTTARSFERAVARATSAALAILTATGSNERLHKHQADVQHDVQHDAATAQQQKT
jgi:hypothetical protein